MIDLQNTRHTEKRLFLRHALKQIVSFCDQGDVAAKFELIMNTLAITRDEILWYAMNADKIKDMKGDRFHEAIFDLIYLLRMAVKKLAPYHDGMYLFLSI